MKLLNGQAIRKAYARFLRSFLFLLLSLILLVLSFFHTRSLQTQDLAYKQQQLEAIFVDQRALNQKIDELYLSLNKLDMNALSNETQTKGIATAKSELDALLKKMSKEHGPAAYVVHSELLSQLHEVIALKDSVYKANERRAYMQEELRFSKK
ncbi:hypothetical protein E4631_22260 [Hymenobacter sp. UV11]|uniref:hypothetical protein n=1 Tax=Hymenobacter sp. UV11 TaxID=1849735 RepID=UPI00105EF2AE|nr:hypothetical protein [Hymenobacter sp. UV11]TDN38646.1 hypothetical protein A8B98_22690 [Hymenobacter sp. UV11]TFZ63560.1 hypothetical protein E4631_22260 [Hymenobacter sp. UV11]